MFQLIGNFYIQRFVFGLSRDKPQTKFVKQVTTLQWKRKRLAF